MPSLLSLSKAVTKWWWLHYFEHFDCFGQITKNIVFPLWKGLVANVWPSKILLRFLAIYWVWNWGHGWSQGPEPCPGRSEQGGLAGTEWETQLRLNCVLTHCPEPFTEGPLWLIGVKSSSHYSQNERSFWLYVNWMKNRCCTGFGFLKDKVSGKLWNTFMYCDLTHWLLVITCLESLLEIVIFDDIFHFMTFGQDLASECLHKHVRRLRKFLFL